MKNSTLPDVCAVVHPATGQAVLIVNGEAGYRPYTGKVTPEKFNDMLGITEEMVDAMMAGSMFGWGVPAARKRVGLSRRNPCHDMPMRSNPHEGRLNIQAACLVVCFNGPDAHRVAQLCKTELNRTGDMPSIIHIHRKYKVDVAFVASPLLEDINDQTEWGRM